MSSSVLCTLHTPLTGQSQFSNSEGQDPCTVAAKVGQICDPKSFIPAIGPGQFYGPTGNNTEPETNPCTCSTVYFSLLTVCSACQAADTALWQDFSAPCITPSPFVLLFFFVEKVEIRHTHEDPLLHYLQASPFLIGPIFQSCLQTNGSINFAAIVADHHILLTEADIVGPSSSAAAATETSKPTSPVSASNSAIASPSIHRQNTGLIIGAVVGPVAFLALLALCTGWWYLRRKSNSTRHRQNDKEESAEVKSSALLETIVEPFIASAHHSIPPSLSKGRLSAQSSDQEIRTHARHASVPVQDISKRLTGATVNSEHRLSAPSLPLNGPAYVHDARMLDVETRPTSMSMHLQPPGHGRLDSMGQVVSETSTSTHDQTSMLESELREMRARVEMLTSEMSQITHMNRYMEVPPAYDSGNNEVAGHGTQSG
ncbi:hypothetical protein D9758_012120 [Tetrapyrgos nigripes]|uniref:Uncharacterized protein n=1 Tax=Tetrapyrgos nigripes TaxID=182062 RepID=A0A8H5CLE1_9AGAR|nr:hypothetical protein D9758_012120 [Tetrapyrgos nigripes]